MKDKLSLTTHITDEEQRAYAVTTLLQHAYLIEFSDASDYMQPAGPACVIWGIVDQDNRDVLKKADYVCTSRIISVLNEKLYRTLNSVYAIQARPEKITLPLSTLPALRAGINPMLLVLERDDHLSIRSIGIEKSTLEKTNGR